jgi:chemotaxis protein methyltransferase CheR
VLTEVRASNQVPLESIEIDLLLEGIYRAYGFDFRHYARGSIRRRIWRRVQAEGAGSVSRLQDLVLHDLDCMDRLLSDLSIRTTAMFRDPRFYQALRAKVVPALRTYPFIRVWNSGCSTGEETYSLAILLHEEGLYERTRIYSTDMNAAALERAQAGRFPIGKMKEYTRNYIAAGGTAAFSRYYTVIGADARFRPWLARNLVFAEHNLVSDRSFNEFNLILCRNVLIYFDRTLQEQVHDLLYESLGVLGVLALGPKESLKSLRREPCYEELDADQRLYRRVAAA